MRSPMPLLVLWLALLVWHAQGVASPLAWRACAAPARLSVPLASALADGAALALPAEWEAVQADDGRTYYWNQLTDEVSWTPPAATADVEEAMAMAAADESGATEAAAPQRAAPALAEDEGAAALSTLACEPVAETLELLEWERLSRQVAHLAGTPAGRAAAVAGLELPEEQAESERLLAETAEAFSCEFVLAQPLELRGFGDIAPLISLASKGATLEGEQLATVASSLTAATALVRKLKAVQSDVAAEERALQQLPALFEGVPVQAELRKLIDEAIDEAGAVRDTAAPQLGELRAAMRELQNSIRRELGGIVQRKAEALAANTITRRGDRYVLQVIAKQKHRVPGIVRDVSSTGRTLFVEPKEVEAANTKLRQLAGKERTLVRKVLKGLSTKVGQPKTVSELERLADAITRVDLAAARARYSERLGAHPVRFGEAPQGGLDLRQLKHPLLVSRTETEDVDASGVVGQDFRTPAHVRAAVVTGPNTGGKTVALKTLGLAALMAKAGLWLVCEAPPHAKQGWEKAEGPAAASAEKAAVALPHFDAVVADIGDEQSLVQSLSTFSAHVARVQRILTDVSPSSLVLLDEVGAGTDPTEGSALGMAVLRRLASSARFTMCTTHHGSLKSLKYTDSRFENACVEFDDEKLAPTYRLLWGIPGRSNAIAIARRLGLQADVIEDAASLLSEGDKDAADVIEAMQAQQEAQRALSDDLVKLKVEAEEARDAMAARAAEKGIEEQRQLAAQRKQLECELAEARAQIAELVQGAGKGAEGASQAGHALAQIGRKADQAVAKASQEASKAAAPAEMGAAAAKARREAAIKAVKAGDRVVVPRLGEAPVDVEARKGNQLTVVYGGLRMKVKLGEVLDVLGAAAPPPQSAKPTRAAKRAADAARGRQRTAVRVASNTLDLRGRRASEVEQALGRAVDKASDLGTLFVIHGRPSTRGGGLRAKVRELLDEEPSVQRFEDAPDNEGGDGCTIAYLR